MTTASSDDSHCKCLPTLRWSCKSAAILLSDRDNSSRGITKSAAPFFIHRKHFDCSMQEPQVELIKFPMAQLKFDPDAPCTRIRLYRMQPLLWHYVINYTSAFPNICLQVSTEGMQWQCIHKKTPLSGKTNPVLLLTGRPAISWLFLPSNYFGASFCFFSFTWMHLAHSKYCFCH